MVWNPLTHYHSQRDQAEGRGPGNQDAHAILEHGTQGSLPTFYRFLVVDVIFDGKIIDDSKVGYWADVHKITNIKHAMVLPRNTIIAKRVHGNSTTDSDPMFLFPFFPSHIALPCKPGEHVWAMFESPDSVRTDDIGYWFCKITEPGFVDDVNHTHAPRALDESFQPPGPKNLATAKGDANYEYRNGRPVILSDGTRSTDAQSSIVMSDSEKIYEQFVTESDGCKLMTYEPVPRYHKRPGDLVLEGSNNTLVVLGTDRVSSAADISKIDPQKGIVPALPSGDLDGPSVGSIDLVAGRGQTDKTLGRVAESKRIDGTKFRKEIGKSKKELVPAEGDPDLKNDRSRIRIAQRTMTDKNLGLDKFNKEFKGVQDPDKGSGAVIVKSDKIRIMARMDVEILVTGFDTDSTTGNVKDLDNPDKYAAIIIKSNGDIVIRPAKAGVIKLGGDDADKAVFCVKSPNASDPSGTVQGVPISNSLGGINGAGGGTGEWAKKILIK